ncbi:esterase/lipase family protein [Lentzea sp. JNUCC 0626]|uniref:esterase/lipase family protein n=1 Tax=Lentzea sp. JNUCC 0626 TaxID=3367513 RepID=UPI003747F879
MRDVVEARLRDLTPDARRERVIVIGHSMGGLVARYWLGPLDGAADCAALITVGTPHGGAPKALDWLVNGVKFGPKRFSALTALLRNWPSAYDLLPRYPAIAGSPERYPHERGAAQVSRSR